MFSKNKANDFLFIKFNCGNILEVEIAELRDYSCQ